MAKIYRIRDHEGLVATDETSLNSSSGTESDTSLEIYSREEFAQVDLGDDDVEDAISHLSRSHGTFVNMIPDCIIGSLSFPDKDDPADKIIHFGFFVNPKRLIFIETEDECAQILAELKDISLLPKVTTFRVFLEFIKHFIEDDVLFLSDAEKTLGDTEDQIIDHHGNVTNQELLEFRRGLMKFSRFYQQLADMTNLISRDEYLIMTKDDRRSFRLFGQRAERLFERSQYLKEYSLQLRELYQMQIDMQQNKTIQWLTVVTSLFVPLTLLTSWYGMNFTNMPELDWPFGYYLVIAISVVLIIGQLIFFKKRKWL